jgi:hypothetical protein
MSVPSLCYGQQDSNYVRKTTISGGLSTSLYKVGYWNTEKQESVQEVNYTLGLSGLSLQPGVGPNSQQEN